MLDIFHVLTTTMALMKAIYYSCDFPAIRVIVEFFLKDLEVPPEIQTVRKNVAEDEKIKHWLNSRPVTNF